jgi:hypothetical protein
MPDTVQRLDIVHEASFAQPAFALLREFPPVMKAFYEVLSSRFSLNTEHISVTPTNVMAELLIRIGLFNNVASVELKPDKMSVRLPNIINPESVAIAKDAITLAHTALEKGLPGLSLSGTSFSVNAWIALEGGAEAADRLFESHARPTKSIDSTLWGAESSRYGIRNYSRSESENWSLTIFGEPSLVPGAHLFLSIDLNILRQGLRPIGEQTALAETKLRQIFSAFGLKFPDEATNAQ